MADALRPLTLLLGAGCLWALFLLLLALTGLGSHFSAAANEGKPPAIPVVSLTRSQSRLGPISDYIEVGERSLMTADRRPAPTQAADGQDGPVELDVVLTSVLITPSLQMAILTGNQDAASYRVRLGETILGSNWRLVQLEARKAVIEGPSGQRTLELRVFDGKGGEAPSPAVANSDTSENGSDAQGAQPPAGAPSQVIAGQAPAQVTQDQQVEAIRRRIEARRAQMRAEAAASGANEKQ